MRFFSGGQSAESRIFLFSIFATRIIFSKGRICLLMVLNLTIPSNYVADTREAIEVLKNYLDENKRGMSYFFLFATSVYIFYCFIQHTIVTLLTLLTLLRYAI